MNLQSCLGEIDTHLAAAAPKKQYNEFITCIHKYVEYAIKHRMNLEFILYLSRNQLSIIIPNGVISEEILAGKDAYSFTIDMKFYHKFLAYGTTMEFPFEDKKILLDFDMEEATPVSYTELMHMRQSYRGMLRILYTVN